MTQKIFEFFAYDHHVDRYGWRKSIITTIGRLVMLSLPHNEIDILNENNLDQSRSDTQEHRRSIRPMGANTLPHERIFR